MNYLARIHRRAGLLLVARRATVAVAAMAVVAGSARETHAQIICGATISAKVVMTNDLAGCATDPAVTVAGGGSLDMNGHQISACTGTGVVLAGAGAKLSNGSINGCVTGVHLQGTGTHKINNIAAVNNSGIGFQIDLGSNGNKFAGCSSIGNGSDGFSITSNKTAVKLTAVGGNGGAGFNILGDNNNLTRTVAIGNLNGIVIMGNANKLSRNTVAAGQQGIAVTGNGNKLLQNNASGATVSGGMVITGNDNLASKNVAADNLGAGLTFNGNDNKLSSNTASDNTLVGFSFAGNGNNVKGCIANHNGSHGFNVASGNGNLLKSNIALGNGGNGILVSSGATNGAVAKTVALENVANDLQDDNGNCDGNVWSKSVFRTSEAGAVPGHACIQ